MKKHLILSLIAFFTSNLPLAQANELRIYVIEPRVEIDWSSPRNLSITTGIDSIGNDYAPIGHFAVEVSCSQANSFGVKRILTGMERKDKNESRRITLQEGLGLGSLMYSFEGALQPAKTSAEEIIQAKKDNRLKIIEIPTSIGRCNAMLKFVEKWIKNGSYQVYGGAKKTSIGEGAGCADFAMELFRLATDSTAPYKWSARIAIPNSLIGSKENPVSFLSLLARDYWAMEGESKTYFKIPDTNRVSRWFHKNGKLCGQHYLWTEHLQISDASNLSCNELRKLIHENTGSLAPTESNEFEFSYPTSTREESIWNKIKI